MVDYIIKSFRMARYKTDSFCTTCFDDDAYDFVIK